MLSGKKSLFVSSIVLTALLLPISHVQADSKGKDKSTPSPAAAAITTSTWISPTLKNSNAANNQAVPQSNASNRIFVKAGSAIPLKFRLFSAGKEVTSAQGISIAAVAVSSCEFKVKSKSNPGKAFTLRYTPNGFESVYKSEKSSSGCFKFEIKSAATTLLTSPEFTFNK